MQVRQSHRPKRWERPFGVQPLTRFDVDGVLTLPLFEGLRAEDFPADMPLGAVIANETRFLRARRGQTIFREGEYGTSTYIVLRGAVRSAMAPRGARLDPQSPSLNGHDHKSWLGSLFKDRKPARVPDQDPPAMNGRFTPPILTLRPDRAFGIIGALTRTPRNATVTSMDDRTVLLEISWPGLRELMRWSKDFRTRIEDLHCEWGIWNCLQGCPLFDTVDDATLKYIAANSSFERHGAFGWSHSFQKQASTESGKRGTADNEPVIVEKGHYLDGLLIVHSGVARITEPFGRGERTIGYATRNSTIGLSLIADDTKDEDALVVPNTVRALGYTDLVRIPTHVVESHLLPLMARHSSDRGTSQAGTEAGPPAFTSFLIQHRFVNGVVAMAIDTNRCVNCDDCVRACAAAHNGQSRFVRHGTAYRSLMVAHACMHCTDPVCMIDCPTGAIDRDRVSGTVIVNDATCVGCGACAEACPFDNIQMIDQRGSDGAFLVDEEGVQIRKANKCDLCAGLAGGPACERACPHNALVRIDLQDAEGLQKWLSAGI